MIELIMTIVIGGIIAIIVGPILMQGINGYLRSQDMTEMDAQGKLAMERMVREIREIANPASDISTMTANQLTFTLSGSSISYTLSGNQLRRNSDPLASDVSSLTFSYFKNDWTTATTDRTLVWRIQIQFQLFSQTFRTSVFLRNAS
jgi:hypothetical protein